MYVANATIELGPVLDEKGAVVHEARMLREGDSISNADLERYQSPEDIETLLKQKALKKG